MSRRDRPPPDPGYEVLPDRPRRRKVPVWAVVLLALVPVMFLAVVGGAVVAYRAYRAEGRAERDGRAGVWAAEREPRRDETGAYDPADLERYFVGKSEAAALEFFGTPLRVVPAGQRTGWAFPCPTRDPATGAKGAIVIVIVDRHTVASVSVADTD